MEPLHYPSVNSCPVVRTAVLSHMGLSVTSNWMFAPELADGHGAARPRRLGTSEDRSLGVFVTGRLASAKARASADFAGSIVAAQSI